MSKSTHLKVSAGIALSLLTAAAGAQTWSSPDYARRPSYTTNFRYSTPIAVNKPLARDLAQGIADKYSLRLVYMGPDDLRIDGPVTLMGKSVEQDSELLGRALGGSSPVVVEVDPRDRILKVVPRGMTDRDIARMRNPLPNDPILALDRSSAKAQAAARAAVDIPSIVPSLTFVVRKGEPLESAISRFARTQGYSLDWRVKRGFESKSLITIDGSSMVEILRQVLPGLGLEADVDAIDHVVIVRPKNPGLDQ